MLELELILLLVQVLYYRKMREISVSPPAVPTVSESIDLWSTTNPSIQMEDAI